MRIHIKEVTEIIENEDTKRDLREFEEIEKERKRNTKTNGDFDKQAYMKNYYEKNKETIKERARRHYKENKEHHDEMRRLRKKRQQQQQKG